MTLILFHKSGDAGNLELPKRSWEGLSLSKNGNIFDVLRLKEKSNAEVAKIYGQNKSSVMKL